MFCQKNSYLLLRNIHITVDHVLISNGYLYAATQVMRLLNDAKIDNKYQSFSLMNPRFTSKSSRTPAPEIFII